ncbi:hypothetical protein [Pseudomonas aeruginosa]|uniref:hypothetical protein n=1 Tax=Pseudomonas aeruginosa TaxID=287 RepID=UPI00367314BF
MSKELNKALDLLREIRPSIPKDVLELWCKDRDAFLAQRSEFHQHLKECADEVATWPTYKREALGPFLGHELGIEGETETANELNKAPVEQAGGDERAAFEAWLAQAMSKKFDPEFDLAKYEDSGEYRYSPAAAYWKAWQARAALAQPSPALPPFAEKVMAKLRRFNECAEDPGSGGVDIGRHWLDLLTQLGLLNRVQRSPALWEISQQGEDLLGTPQPSPASDLDPFNLAPHAEAFNEAPDEALKPEQAEAERPEVVARVVHSNPVVLGQCGPLNANDELMTVAQHAASVARWAEIFNRVEQERDAALARTAELAQALRHLLHNIKASGKRIDLGLAKECAEAALARIDSTAPSQAQHSVPDGYALVPLEPTDDMLVAGQEAWTHKMERRGALEDCEEAGDVYRAMLAAAPGKEGL